MNSIVFAFSGGLGDQIGQLLFVLKNRDKIHPDTKIIFTDDYGFERYDRLAIEYYNVKKYINYEYIHIPKEIMKLYNDSGIYNYSMYKNYKYELMVENDNELISFKPPFIYKATGGGDYVDNFYSEFQDLMTLQIPLNEPNKLKLNEIKAAKNPVCIHIRMGDCLNPKQMGHYLPSPTYFINSIRSIAKQLNNDCKFFVFSNSIDIAKSRLENEQLLKSYSIDFVNLNEDNKPFFELELMRNCKHFILSGGTFSNLAKTLSINNDSNKIVIKPMENDFDNLNREKTWGYTFDKKYFV